MEKRKEWGRENERLEEKGEKTRKMHIMGERRAI